MVKNTGNVLPLLYARWMNDFLDAPLPVEPRAVCAECHMIRQREIPCPSDAVFHPNTKCCTFMPEVPNFLVGAVLADTSTDGSAGREAFEKGALSQAVINPLGVFPTPEYTMNYRFNYRTFGQREGLRCPYYMVEAGGLCAVWQHRNSRCSTWFCTHERGSLSVVFWKYLDKLLAAVETALARWCLLRIDLGGQALTELIPASGDPVAGSKTVWGRWAGREREFFMECSRAVQVLQWADVMEIVGPETHMLARLVEDAFRKWQTFRIPQRLVRGQWKAETVVPGRKRVWTFSPFDPLDLDVATLDALILFDGCSATADIVQEIENRFGIRLEPTLLQRLCDVQILVPCDTSGV